MKLEKPGINAQVQNQHLTAPRMLKMEFNSAQALYSTMLTDQEEETVVAETMHLLYQHWMKNVE